MFIYIYKGIFSPNEDVCVLTANEFGSKCNPRSSSVRQCGSGLVCSKLGYYTGVCLKAKGEKCATNFDCTNLLTCQIDGKCGCETLKSISSAFNCEYLKKFIF